MAKTLITIFFIGCRWSFVAYVSLIIVGCSISLIIKAKQLIKEWRNKRK